MTAQPDALDIQLTVFLTAQQKAMEIAPDLTGDQLDRIGNLAVSRFDTADDISDLHLKFLIRRVKRS